jgi:hypothetical protein
VRKILEYSKTDFSEVIHGPETLISPENLPEIQVSKPYLRPTESKTL